VTTVTVLQIDKSLCLKDDGLGCNNCFEKHYDMTQKKKEMHKEKNDVKDRDKDDYFLIGCAKGSIISWLKM